MICCARGWRDRQPAARAATRPAAAPGEHLVAAAAARVAPAADARRHRPRGALSITLTKWLLPAGALLLLATHRALAGDRPRQGSARIAFQRMGGEVGGAHADRRPLPRRRRARPALHGDRGDRPAGGPERINLTVPKGDITLENGTWLMLQAKQGVYLQHTNQLDLSHDVTLYRDDGTTVTTASASIDLKSGAAASAEPTHAEGPFGTLDAQGFTVTDKGTAIQFAGPAHLVLNGARHDGNAQGGDVLARRGACSPAAARCRRRSCQPRGHSSWT